MMVVRTRMGEAPDVGGSVPRERSRHRRLRAVVINGKRRVSVRVTRQIHGESPMKACILTASFLLLLGGRESVTVSGRIRFPGEPVQLPAPPPRSDGTSVV